MTFRWRNRAKCRSNLAYENANFEEINDGRDYIDSELIDHYSYIREGYADFPDDDDPQILMDKGRAELAKRELPEITYDIRLAQMQGSVQYAAYCRLEHFDLGDTAVLHTDTLSKDVILRMTEVETDCLTGRNTSVRLGNADKALLESITAGASASDRLASVLTSDGYLQAEKVAGKLNLVRIENLSAEIAKVVTAQIGEADITAAQIKDLEAEIVRVIDLSVDWAEVTSLQTQIAEIVKTNIGEAEIDFAQIWDLVAEKQIIAKGEAVELYIADLSVTEGNMTRLSIGQLLLRGSDGRFYEIFVDEETGAVTSRDADVAGAIEDGSIDAGEKLIDGSITAQKINA